MFPDSWIDIKMAQVEHFIHIKKSPEPLSEEEVLCT